MCEGKFEEVLAAVLCIFLLHCPHMSLVKLTCADIVPKWQVLVTLKATDTIQEALEELRDRHFRSVPVVGNDGRPVGFVDVLDLVAYLVSVFPKPRLAAALSALATDTQLIEGEDLETFWQEAKFRMISLQDANVISMTSIPHRCCLFPLLSSSEY